MPVTAMSPVIVCNYYSDDREELFLSKKKKEKELHRTKKELSLLRSRSCQIFASTSRDLFFVV